MSEHTPGVMLAAEKICSRLARSREHLESVAAIIEQETGLAELLAACEWLLGQFRQHADFRHLTAREAGERDAALAAIAKAKTVRGEQATAPIPERKS